MSVALMFERCKVEGPDVLTRDFAHSVQPWLGKELHSEQLDSDKMQFADGLFDHIFLSFDHQTWAQLLEYVKVMALGAGGVYGGEIVKDVYKGTKAKALHIRRAVFKKPTMSLQQKSLLAKASNQSIKIGALATEQKPNSALPRIDKYEVDAYLSSILEKFVNHLTQVARDEYHGIRVSCSPKNSHGFVFRWEFGIGLKHLGWPAIKDDFICMLRDYVLRAVARVYLWNAAANVYVLGYVGTACSSLSSVIRVDGTDDADKYSSCLMQVFHPKYKNKNMFDERAVLIRVDDNCHVITKPNFSSAFKALIRGLGANPNLINVEWVGPE